MWGAPAPGQSTGLLRRGPPLYHIPEGMPSVPNTASALHMLRHADFRAFMAASVLAGLGESALAVLLGVTVWELARDPLALAWLGLVEAAPAIGLVLLGGHVADRFPRRRVVVLCRLALATLAGTIAFGATLPEASFLPLLYGCAFAIGTVRAFADPAHSGLEAQVVPFAMAVQAGSLLGSTSRAFRLAAPVAGGFLYDAAGPAATYATIAALLAASAAVVWFLIPPRPAPGGHADTGGVIANIGEGVRFVFSDQVLVGSMALDLFAVFFGGVMGLLPVFADMFGWGAQGVGLMRAAMASGALLAMLVAVRHPPRERAGLALHLAIAAFGLAIIVFGLSETFLLSLAALFVAGICDGVSVVIRHAILRMVAPESMRGRIAAVRMVFINSSNELGDVESGLAAHWLGPAAAVWAGGLVTLGVVAVTAAVAPRLLRLDLTRLRPRE
jgi:MFS family permease